MPRWFYLTILNLISLTFGDGSRPSHAFTNKETAATRARAHVCIHTGIKRACDGAVRVRARLCVASWFPTGFDICPRLDPPSASLARGAARDTSSPGPPPIVGTPLPESRWLPVLPTGSTRPVQHLLPWIPFTVLRGLYEKHMAFCFAIFSTSYFFKNIYHELIA